MSRKREIKYLNAKKYLNFHTYENTMKLEGIKYVDDVWHQPQLWRNKLSNSHQIQNLDCDLQLLRMMREAGGHVTAPVRDEDSEDGPDQDGAVAEGGSGPGQEGQQGPGDGVSGQYTGDGQVPLYGHLDELLLGPGEAVVHDVGADHLHQHQGQLLGSLPSPDLAQPLDDPRHQPPVDLRLVATDHLVRGGRPRSPPNDPSVVGDSGPQRLNWFGSMFIIILDQTDCLLLPRTSVLRLEAASQPGAEACVDAGVQQEPEYNL